MIRLIVIEDHLTMVVSSLRFLFRPERDGIQITGAFERAEIAIAQADPGSFDLIILDLYIATSAPIQNFRMLRKAFPDKPVIIYTSETSSAWKSRMMREGAQAYLTKDATRDELKSGIMKASQGEYVVSGRSIQAIRDDLGIISPGDVSALSVIEIEALKLLSAGMEHKKIAERINLSRSNVERIFKRIRHQFHARNNVELISILISRGIL